MADHGFRAAEGADGGSPSARSSRTGAARVLRQPPTDRQQQGTLSITFVIFTESTGRFGWLVYYKCTPYILIDVVPQLHIDLGDVPVDLDPGNLDPGSEDPGEHSAGYPPPDSPSSYCALTARRVDLNLLQMVRYIYFV